MCWRWSHRLFFFLVEGLVLWSSSSEGNPNARAIFVVRQGENITVPCWSSWFSRYKDAHYTWLDHLDRGAARNEMILHGDGTMEIPEAQLSDTDGFKCLIHLPGPTIETHTHTVIVYTIAEYYMSYPFIYDVSECNYQLDNFKMHELHEFVCRDYETNCPFHAVSTCHKYQSALSQIERSQLTVFIQQHPLEVYRPPSCDVICIKNSIVEHFKLMGAYIIRELYKMEQSSQRKIYGNIVFSREASFRLAEIKARCQSGYELYQDILCMPCYPGHSLKYTYTTEEDLTPTASRVHQRCEPCPAHKYQDSFGMEECFYCPKATYTKSNGSISQELCRKKSVSISWTLMILFGLLAAFLAAICCTWCILGCIASTNTWRIKKKTEGVETSTVVGKSSEFPPLNDQTPWIEMLRQCEESARSSPVGSIPAAQSPVPFPAPTPSPVPVPVPVPVHVPPAAAAFERPSGTVSLRSALKHQRSTIDNTSIDANSPVLFGRHTPVDSVYYPQPPPPPPPPPPPIEYHSIQSLPEVPYPGPPSPLPPIHLAVATPRTLEPHSMVSVRPPLRPLTRQPVPLVSKPSDTNIYRRALQSGLREVRIIPPESDGRTSRSISAENWSQHSGSDGNVYPREIRPSNASSNSRQDALPVQHAQPSPTEAPSSAPGLFRDQSGVLMSGQPRRSNRSSAELGQQFSRGPPVEIEVEFQRVPSATPLRRPSSPRPSGGAQAQAFGQQSEAGLESQRESQQVDIALAHRQQATQPGNVVRQRLSRQQQSGTMPQNISSGTTAQIRDSELVVEFERPIDANRPRSRDRSSISWSQQLQQVEMEGQEEQEGPHHHIRQQSSGSTQASDADPRTRLSVARRRRSDSQQTTTTPSQRSSETTQTTQGSSETTTQQTSTTQQSTSETGSRSYTTGSQRSSELDHQSTATRQSSESDHQRSAMAAYHQQQHPHPQTGPEAAVSQGRPSRRMNKSLIDAINARSAPTHEDSNVYD